MSERPWYKRYGADFVHGTLGLTLEEKGAYSLCLDLIYDRQGPIPDDDRWLSGVCGVSVRKWRALRNRLIEVGKLVVREGGLSNVRAEKEIENALKTSRKRVESGAKGGRVRAENERISKENNDIEQAPLKLARANIPDTRVEERKKPSVSKENSGTRLPADWVLPSEWEGWARLEGHHDPPGEAERFRDYWHGVPGQRGRKADWFATWRNWIRKSVDEQKPRGSNGGLSRTEAALVGIAAAVDERR